MRKYKNKIECSIAKVKIKKIFHRSSQKIFEKKNIFKNTQKLLTMIVIMLYLQKNFIIDTEL